MSTYELEQTDQLVALYTIIRDEKTKRDEFIFCADRIIRMLVEKASEFLPTKPKEIKTPTGCTFDGREFVGKICAVSIVRSGEAMEKAARDICQKIRIGKILIQRDEKTAKPILFYHKLPEDIAERYVLLLDPMLATGGSACKAAEILKQNGVKEEKIVFVNLISCPEGINEFTKKFPKVKIITGVIDKSLNEKAYILPGLGDFGDRYFGT
ncbi:MAG TPA: uracil phosphoribosyltransferase [Nanoarchaeota archaeon]|nr:uracil phosphoribosyltransferase [Nanoarchaeota archaeon]